MNCAPSVIRFVMAYVPAAFGAVGVAHDSGNRAKIAPKVCEPPIAGQERRTETKALARAAMAEAVT